MNAVSANRLVGTALLAGLAVTVTAVGCASAPKNTDFPPVVEAIVEAEPGLRARIDYIDVRPWEAKAGEPIEIIAGGTPGLQAGVTMIGASGEATGRRFSSRMQSDGQGRYIASWTPDPRTPPGRYKVQVTLSGDQLAEPASLTTQRTLEIKKPPEPEPEPGISFDEARRELATPRIFFEFDADDLDQSDREWIQHVAEVLNELGARVNSVVVVGHCDERGTNEYNLALGGRRARAVMDYLMSQPGMDAFDVSTMSRGEEEPLIAGARNDEEHAQNRRALFLID